MNGENVRMSPFIPYKKKENQKQGGLHTLESVQEYASDYGLWPSDRIKGLK